MLMSAFNASATFVSGKINGEYGSFPVNGWPYAFQFRPQEKKHFEGYNPVYNCDIYDVTMDVDAGDKRLDDRESIRCHVYIPDWRLQEYFEKGIFVVETQIVPTKPVKSASFTKAST